ncbi:hypothetical protein ACTMTJ_35700 [Phytohabitans sp. LJ34]|uniref:hypothetical protein n=1 Tax=Phytohabitans sp. LJ34 TaxID=3452217 RepID=UPI003F8A6EA9
MAGRMRSGLFGLVAALVAAGALLAQTPVGARSPKTPPPPVAAAWPQVTRATIPGTLPDGAAYTPVYFLDERASVGTALDPRGGGVRLVLRAADGAIRELRRGTGRFYAGFTRDGDQLVWAESVTAEDGVTRTELWRAALAGGAPRKVTADTGWVSFENSDHDIVAAAGQLHWTAAARSSTEIRSVPLGGGPVRVRTEPGAWALTAWPWLVSTGSGQRGPMRLLNLDTGQTTTVKAGDDTPDQCGPTWCRLFALRGDDPVRSVLMRPDGSDRQTATDDGATAAIADVAVLDRFEVLAGDSSTLATAVGGARLLIYDLKTRQLVNVAEAASRVSYRGGVLWWSTSGGDNTTWHSIDLRTV